mgnify:CR=1 FL=1
MAKKSVSQMVEEMAKPIVENLGYELVEVKYAKGAYGMDLTLFIHSENGISLDDCEKVSKALDAPLDELNPTNDQPYSLNVSSLGLDRPIKTADDARRNLGNEVDVKLYVPKDGKKLYTGILTEYTPDSITINQEQKKYTFKFAEIANCTQVIKF